MRREHIRVAKEEQKRRLAAATLALTADPKTMDPYAMKVILRAWQSLMIDTRAQSAIKVERQRGEEREKERKSQAQRRFAMLITEGSLPMRNGSFHAWKAKVQSKKEELKRREVEQRLNYLQGIYRAWSTLACAAKREKELEQEKERLHKEQEDLRKEVEEQRLRNSQMRGSLLAMTDEPNLLLLLGSVWNSWKELLVEKRIMQEREAERQKWAKEFQDASKLQFSCQRSIKTSNGNQIYSIKRRFPSFSGKVPDEARFWSEEDLEAFFRSNGQSKPRESARPGVETCPLLSKLRLELAKQKIDEPTIEYAAFSRYLQGVREDWYRNPHLTSVAECREVPRLRSLERAMVQQPTLLEKPRDWYARFWNLEFFKRDCGHDYWFCRPQFPAFDGDEAAIDKLALHASIAEFVEYARTLQRMDRKCDQEKSLAFPRLTLDGYAPFFGVMRKFFDECWSKLGPEGLPDLSPRLAQVFAHHFSLPDPMETLSRFYKVTLAATGSITRLHVEVAGAHIWLNQVEGRRVFFLFPPSESRKLYEETGGPMQETSGFATSVSGVDILASAKRHPLFAEASCRVAVLYLGQTLVIPAGWWWYSVSLDPSVTLWHHFWTQENKHRFPEIAWEYFNYQKMTPEFWTALPRKVEALRAQQEVLLPILWSAWRDLVLEKRRDEQLDLSRRLVEEEVKKAQQEARQLHAEAAQMRERHLHAQQKRQAIFLLSLETRDRALLLQITWSAWRECLEDRRKLALDMVKQKLPPAVQDLMSPKAGDQGPAGSQLGQSKRPGLCQRLCRCLPGSKTKGAGAGASRKPSAVAQAPAPAPPPPQTVRPESRGADGRPPHVEQPGPASLPLASSPARAVAELQPGQGAAHEPGGPAARAILRPRALHP
ncbi:unnamed protein product [Effrenium voratum]|nr:unnamed protein product [Effrenium voratum]